MNKPLQLIVIVIAILLLIISGVWWFTQEEASAPVAVKDESEIPFMRLDRILLKKKDFSTVEKEKGSSISLRNGNDDTAGETGAENGDSQVKGNIPIYQRKKRKKRWTWSTSSAYQSMFKPPPPPINPTYAQVMNDKKDEISRRMGFDPSFGPIMESAFRNPTLQDAEKLYAEGKSKIALEKFKMLLEKSDNVMIQAIASSYITQIYRDIGDDEMFKAAQANMAILSARVASKAFPELVRQMGMKSPDVKKAFERLIKGERIPL